MTGFLDDFDGFCAELDDLTEFAVASPQTAGPVEVPPNTAHLDAARLSTASEASENAHAIIDAITRWRQRATT